MRLPNVHYTLAGASAEVGRDSGTGIPARLGRLVDALSVLYERTLGGVLHHARAMVVAGILLVVGGWFAYRAVETGFMPEMDEGAFVIDYFTPGGTALAETDRHLKEVDKILASMPEVTATSRRTAFIGVSSECADNITLCTIRIDLETTGVPARGGGRLKSDHFRFCELASFRPAGVRTRPHRRSLNQLRTAAQSQGGCCPEFFQFLELS